ncbi:MAG TPA: spore coat protein [Firmicutes bacterium]|nr:spore coat protein [Bacillota bacterium]
MPFGGMSDKDMLGDLLSSIKHMSTTYHAAVLESADNHVRQTFESLHDDQINQAKGLFDAMHTRGWYKVEPAHPTPPS